MKVFISSVISGMAPYRDVAARAVRTLGHEPRMAEDYGALSDTPQQACLAGVRDADVVILLLGARYGHRQESELSATHEEYREAQERRPVLAFVHQEVEREAAQEDFVHEVQNWSSGQYTASFSMPEDLREVVTRGLHQLELSRAAGPVDEDEMLARAEQSLPVARGFSQTSLSLVVAGGPLQQVLRPAELEADVLSDTLMQEALFGPNRILDPAHGTNRQLEGHGLIIKQDQASIRLDELGTVMVTQPVRDEKDRGGYMELPVLIEEEIRARIERELLFAGWVLDHVDPVRRLSDVVVVATVLGGGYLGWRTRAEHTANPNTISGGTGGSDRISVRLSPARRNRAALILDAARISEDLSVLLRREIQR
jgi:hypothetical protein